MSYNFVRRYKWLFYPDYDSLPPMLPPPNLTQCIPQITEIILVSRNHAASQIDLIDITLQDSTFSASNYLALARDILRYLSDTPVPQCLVNPWKEERKKVSFLFIDLISTFTGRLSSFGIWPMRAID